MLICFVLCAAAVLPTALSQRLEAQQVQQSNGELIRKLAAIASSLRSQPQLRLEPVEDRPSHDDTPYLHDLYVSLTNPYLPPPDLDLSSDIQFLRSPLGGGRLLRRDTVLDSIGGGHLLRRGVSLDSLGGGHLLKRGWGERQLDSIGGGHLLKRGGELAQLDSIGGGHLLKRYWLGSEGGGRFRRGVRGEGGFGK